MEFLSMVVGVFSSAGFGTLLGALFGYLNRREETKLIEVKQAHEIDLINANTNAQKELQVLDIEETRVRGEVKERAIEAKAFEESQVGGGDWSEKAKAMMRPVITILLMVMVAWIYFQLNPENKIPFTAEQSYELTRIIILMITSLCATAVGWWFASRSSKQFDKLMAQWGRR